jgi:predicted TIM-barrel fold metal-dependent hydrolase
MMPVQSRIDVHHHFLSEDYVASWGKEKLGSITAAGSVVKWSLDLSLELMDRNDISAALLSVSSPGWPAGSARAQADLCRKCNELSASIVGDTPSRFGMFTNVPLPDVDLALSEIAYGFDTLQADGVALFTNYHGHYLGDPRFDPIFSELNRRNSVVFVHPISPLNANKIPGISESTLDYPLETTRAIVSLLYNGVPARYPNVRLIFTHAGGAAPFLAGRIATFSGLNPSFKQKDFDGVLPALKSFFYDITQSANPYTFAALLKLIPISQLLFGSDVPFARQQQIELTTHTLPELGLPNSALAAINFENAGRLFPRLVV